MLQITEVINRRLIPQRQLALIAGYMMLRHTRKRVIRFPVDSEPTKIFHPSRAVPLCLGNISNLVVLQKHRFALFRLDFFRLQLHIWRLVVLMLLYLNCFRFANLYTKLCSNTLPIFSKERYYFTQFIDSFYRQFSWMLLQPTSHLNLSFPF